MSHVPPTTSPIAHAVISGLATDGRGLGHLGAIVLRGHLLAVNDCGQPHTKTIVVGEDDDKQEVVVPDDETNRSWRLYDDTFTMFVQFERNALLHHQPGDQTDQCCATGIVWIRNEAKILEGRTGEAYSIGGPGGDGGWHKPGGGWHKPGGGWHKPGGGWGDDPGDWHKPGGG